MRIVFVGAEEVAVRAAEFLIGKGHEVVIIDTDREKIDELSERMDCSFLTAKLLPRKVHCRNSWPTEVT